MDRKNLFVASFLLASFLTTLPVYAIHSSEVLTKENDTYSTASMAVDNYWTPTRLMNAKPMPIPQVVTHNKNEVLLSAINNSSIKKGHVEGGDGQPPKINVKIDFQHLFIPTQNSVFKTNENSMFATFDRGEHHDRGTLKEDFSSSRLVPMTADLVYPYRAVGKLFFTIPGEGDFVCSASVLRPRVLITAGHCVHKGSGGTAGFYTNWKFIPAYRDGNAPLQTWNWTYVATTKTWATGNGGVPNAADYAMIELEDRTFNGVLQKIGSITGFFGYQTLSLIPNHAHLLGYPCNLDSCQKMHQVTAQSARTVAPNNAEYGSDMGGGSSGGPWVQNFGEFAVGQTGGLNAGLNRIVGVTSFGYTNVAPKAEGASIPDARFTDLLNTLCTHKAGNC